MSLKSKMPLQVWILTLSAFAIGTAEFVIAGVLPQVAGSLGITEGQAGNLITAYALAIVIAGPILTLWLARFEKRTVLVGLMAIFIAGNSTAKLLCNELGPDLYNPCFEADLLPSDRTIELLATPTSTAESGHIFEPKHGWYWQRKALIAHAVDMFNDGTIYISNAPGQVPGHLNALIKESARTNGCILPLTLATMLESLRARQILVAGEKTKVEW